MITMLYKLQILLSRPSWIPPLRSHISNCDTLWPHWLRSSCTYHKLGDLLWYSRRRCGSNWHNILWWRRTHFAKSWWAHNTNLPQILLAMVCILPIQSDHNFAHVTATELPRYMQNCYHYFCYIKATCIFRDLDYELINVLLNGS